ncbi:MAG: imidazole glycerol phosphate synthase subunit HisH [Oscillospiraceae bacterium]|nr:imidazole glycerol phosphate synthase subunit HisH [Candidatus Equicaccousia limihippi]
MTAIIDYGVGNLFSLLSSFEKIGEKAVITSNADDLIKADRIVLPGVGAFGDAAEKLQSSGLVGTLFDQIKKGKPVLGICLGMQLLFDKSYEYGEYKGLGLISGSVVPMADKVQNLKIPHMGWNALKFHNGGHPLFKYINEGDHVYFVHSFYGAECEKSLIASAEYGIQITAAVANKNVMGCQFHPEKSGVVGLKILKSFCEMKEGAL